MDRVTCERCDGEGTILRGSIVLPCPDCDGDGSLVEGYPDPEHVAGIVERERKIRHREAV